MEAYNIITQFNLAINCVETNASGRKINVTAWNRQYGGVEVVVAAAAAVLMV
jgi:hypothetical protein